MAGNASLRKADKAKNDELVYNVLFSDFFK